MAQSFLLTTALIEEINENLPMDPTAVKARNILQDYRDGLLTAAATFNELLILRDSDKGFFRRMDSLTNGQWTNCLLLLVR